MAIFLRIRRFLLWFPSAAKNFLEQFGIDIRNPIKQHLTDNVIVENQIEQEVVYVVNGIAKSDTGYEIDIGTVQIVIDEEYIFEPNKSTMFLSNSI